MSINWWFTSDTHFGHGNIIKYCGRPFFNKNELGIYLDGRKKNASSEEKNALYQMKLSSASLAAHDEFLIENWNRHVKPRDKVIHLGDFAFGNSTRLNEIRDKLNGSISLIIGNHDKNLKANFKTRFEWVDTYREISIQDGNNLQRIVLCHYAFKTWNNINNGVWDLYGHSHGNLCEDNLIFAIDVGVDAIAKRLSGKLFPDDLPTPENYRPISFEEVRKIMETKRAKSAPNTQI